MIKKILYTFSAVLLIFNIAFFSGCQIEADPEEVQQPITEDEDAVHEISFGMWDIYEPQSEAAVYISDYIEDKFKIKIKPMTFTKDNYKNELEWMIGANMLPDVFAHDVTEDKLQYKVMKLSGLIQPIPKELWSKEENISRVMSWYENIYAVGGEMYFIPRTYQTFDQTHGATNVIFYRSDWAGELSQHVFSNTAKFTDIVDLLGAYRSSDPDSNSIWDTWGITGSGGIDFIWEAFLTPFGVREWMQTENGWIPGIISNEAKEAISWAAQLYREGVIDPDIDRQTTVESLGKFFTGKAGAVLAPAYYSDLKYLEQEWNVHNPDKTITNCVKIIPTYLTPSGQIHNEVTTFEGGTMISSRVSEKKMEKVISLMNFLFSEDGRDLMETGNGNITDDMFIMTAPEFSAFYNMASWNMDKNPLSSVQNSSFIEYSNDMIENNIWPWSYENELFTNGMITPEMCIIDIDSIAEEKIMKLIKTTRDFDADWDNFVASMYSELNLDEAIDEVNQRAEEYFSDSTEN